jgi:hypothetical protein
MADKRTRIMGELLKAPWFIGYYGALLAAYWGLRIITHSFQKITAIKQNL